MTFNLSVMMSFRRSERRKICTGVVGWGGGGGVNGVLAEVVVAGGGGGVGGVGARGLSFWTASKKETLAYRNDAALYTRGVGNGIKVMATTTTISSAVITRFSRDEGEQKKTSRRP